MRSAPLLVALAVAALAVPAALSSHGERRDQGPDWSPDGKRIAFSSNPGHASEVWIANADGTGHRNLTKHGAFDTAPAWSPDGRRIAFSSTRNGPYNLYVIDVETGAVTRVTQSPYPDFNATWSPDGSRIAFYRRRSDANRSEIWTVRSDGSDERLVSSASEAELSPAWSPDGEWILFQSYRDGNFELYLVRPDGTDATRLTTTPDRWEGEPGWSPDGSRIVFSAGAGEADRDVYVMNADGSGERRVTHIEAPLWAPRWSPDGSRIVFFRFPPGGIYVVDADGSRLASLFGDLSLRSFATAPKRPAAGRTVAAVLRVRGRGPSGDGRVPRVGRRQAGRPAPADVDERCRAVRLAGAAEAEGEGGSRLDRRQRPRRADLPHVLRPRPLIPGRQSRRPAPGPVSGRFWTSLR